MPRLTAQSVAALKPRSAPYYVADGLVPGLAIRVAINGSKVWSFRFRFGTKLKVLPDGTSKRAPAQWRWTIGGYPALSLADARERARAGERKLADGKNPMVEQQEQRTAGTFESLATVYVEKHAKKRKKSWKYDEWQLRSIVMPEWRNRLARDITRDDVNRLLQGIVSRGAPVLANRTRALLSKVFAFGIKSEEERTFNISMNPVDQTERPCEESSRDRVLTRDELRLFWQNSKKLALEMRAFWQLRLLTAQRGGEIGGMEWQHLDLTTGWWTIPAGAVKNGSTHRVPLSRRALKILKELKEKSDERGREQGANTQAHDYVLKLARGKRQQREAATSFGIQDFRGHDLRRTASTLMGEGGIDPHHVGYVLNHKTGTRSGVTWIYNRFSYDPQKRAALDKLDAMIAEIVGADDDKTPQTAGGTAAQHVA